MSTEKVRLLTEDDLREIHSIYHDIPDVVHLVALARWAAKAHATLKFFDNYPGVKALLATIDAPEEPPTEGRDNG